MKYRVDFIAVGPRGVSWSELLDERPTEPLLVRLVEAKHVLLASQIWCTILGDWGVVAADNQQAGRFEIKELPEWPQ